jgi:hypothetical protein
LESSSLIAFEAKLPFFNQYNLFHRPVTKDKQAQKKWLKHSAPRKKNPWFNFIHNDPELKSFLRSENFSGF